MRMSSSINVGLPHQPNLIIKKRRKRGNLDVEIVGKRIKTQGNQGQAREKSTITLDDQSRKSSIDVSTKKPPFDRLLRSLEYSVLEPRQTLVIKSLNNELPEHLQKGYQRLKLLRSRDKYQSSIEQYRKLYKLSSILEGAKRARRSNLITNGQKISVGLQMSRQRTSSKEIFPLPINKLFLPTKPRRRPEDYHKLPSIRYRMMSSIN